MQLVPAARNDATSQFMRPLSGVALLVQYRRTSASVAVAGQPSSRPLRNRKLPDSLCVRPGHCRHWADRRSRVAIGYSAVVGRPVSSSDSFTPCQRTAPDPQRTVASSLGGRPRERTNNDASGSRDSGFPQRLGRENMLTRFPSGSRNKSERLPHGINVVGITMFVQNAFIRSNTASTSSTSNSRIAD